MKHTLKWSAFVGVGIAGAVLLLLKLFQPISYWHLVAFGYAFVVAAVIAGIVTHLNLVKRGLHKIGHEMHEAEKKIEQKIGNTVRSGLENPQPQYSSHNNFFLHRGKFAILHTHDGKIHRGRFQSIDDKHVIMDYISDLSEPQKIKSLVMLNKDDVKKLEVE